MDSPHKTLFLASAISVVFLLAKMVLAQGYLDKDIEYNINKGQEAYLQNEYQKAIDIWEQTLEKVKNAISYSYSGRRAAYEFVINTLLGIAYHDIGNPIAIDYYEDALESALRTTDLKIIVKSLNEICVACVDLGDYSRALHYCQKAIKFSNEINDSLEIGKSYTNIANLFLRFNEYSQAIDMIDKALDLQGKIRDTKGIGINYNNLGGVYTSLGDYTKALHYFQKALNIHEMGKNQIGMVFNLTNIGHLHRKWDQYDKALENFQRAFELSKQIKYNEGVKDNLGNIGDIYFEQGNIQKALEIYQETLKLSRESINSYRFGKACNKLGQYYMAISILQEVIEYEFQRVMNIPEKMVLGDPEILILAYSSLGESFEGLLSYEEAISYYLKAIEIVESVRSIFQIEEYKQGFFASQQKPYENIIEILYKLHSKGVSVSEVLNVWGDSYATIAFYFTEKSNARSLAEIIGGARSKEASHILPDSLIEKETTLTYRLFNLRVRFDEMYSKEKATYKELKENITETEKKLKELINVIRENYPTYAALKYPETVTLKNIPLHSDEILIEYKVTEVAIFLFLVDSSQIRKFLRIPIGREEIEAKILDFRVSFNNQNNNILNLNEAQELYTLLVAPALEGIEKDKHKHIIIIPDGPLHLLPFEALVVDATNNSIDPSIGVPSFQNMTYVLDEWEVSYYQSATVLTINRVGEQEKSILEKPLFAVGDPIFDENDPRRFKVLEEKVPHLAIANSNSKRAFFPIRSAAASEGYRFQRLPKTRDEVLAIANFYGIGENSDDIKLGSNANEKDIKQMDLTLYQYIVFATHGILGTEVPYLQQPALVLSLVDTLEENGFLTMEEILGLRLNADLVTLSACQTGLGTNVKGEGIIGLTRAFMYAGTPSLVVSQWSVADQSTAEFMAHFYRNLKNGMSKAKALRETKLWMIRESYHTDEYGNVVLHSHPFYWAPFVLIGEYQ